VVVDEIFVRGYQFFTGTSVGCEVIRDRLKIFFC